MHGSARCTICGTLTSAYIPIGRWSGGTIYACEDIHEKEARAQLGRLRQSDAAMGNKNARKRQTAESEKGE